MFQFGIYAAFDLLNEVITHINKNYIICNQSRSTIKRA